MSNHLEQTGQPENLNESSGQIEHEKVGAGWWQRSLTRREAGVRIAAIGAASLLAAGGALSFAGCGDDDGGEDDGTDVDQDALELQKKMGWNAGSTDKSLTFTGKATSDSQGGMNWSSFAKPTELLKAWGPKNATWQPYVVATLAQSLDQASLRGQIGPVHTAAMEAAYGRGLGMKEILKKTKEPGKTLIVVDIPGPEAVAYAAALSDVADPIITFDNWPHPLGVVKAHETLGALLYYAGEVQANAAKRSANAPAVMVLDGNRLASYTDADSQFDNRYMAKVPPADKLASLGVTSVLYAVPDSSNSNERDDLNEDFTAYKSKGINVSLFALSDFTPDPNATSDSTMATAGTTTVRHSTYYYGGGPMFSPWFFYHYPVFVGYSAPAMTRLPATNLTGRSYTPTPRPTMFASRTTGGASGVGRAKPTGFGRVSTRVDGTGRTTGIRSGSYGSYSRSSSGRSSSGRSGSYGRGGSYSG